MFAFVIWDRQERRAFGARDYFGIKPMFYLQTVDGVYLASEKKALLPFAPAAHAGDAGVDTANLSHYLTLQYVDPDSKVSGITSFKLENKDVLESVLVALAEKSNMALRGDVYVKKKTDDPTKTPN